MTHQRRELSPSALLHNPHLPQHPCCAFRQRTSHVFCNRPCFTIRAAPKHPCGAIRRRTSAIESNFLGIEAMRLLLRCLSVPDCRKPPERMHEGWLITTMDRHGGMPDGENGTAIAGKHTHSQGSHTHTLAPRLPTPYSST